jgi:hypothetical protein
MGLVLVIIGAVLILLAFTTLSWYSGSGGADTVSSSGFSALHHNATLLGANAVTTGYFSWIAWVLLILVIVAGTAASAVPQYRDAARISGLFVGLVGVALTYYALHSISFSGKIFDEAGPGVYLTLLGYLLAGVGSALGPWPFARASTGTPAEVAGSPKSVAAKSAAHRPAATKPAAPEVAAPQVAAPQVATPQVAPVEATTARPAPVRPSPGIAAPLETAAAKTEAVETAPIGAVAPPADPPVRRRPSPS